MNFGKGSFISYPYFFVLGIVTFFSVESICAQDYFQQQVDYNLHATLVDSTQHLKVKGYFDYTNNSPDALSFLYMHQWWDAFGDKQSAFARQQFEYGEYAFHFAKEEALGGYEDIVYSQEVALSVEPYEEDGVRLSDIIQLILAEPISAGGQTRIHFEYLAKVPENFSRPGYDGEMYRMTQWYPKPAVYDSEGWHPMPYLSVGEFYADYGNYEVTIEAPSTINIAATGTKQKEEQLINTDRSSATSRTFIADNVIDFAWFASDRFQLKEKTIELENTEISLSLFTDFEQGQEEVLNYMEDAIRFYSAEVGLYGYPQYTLVLNEGRDRGGMEYPMISIVDHSKLGQNLDNLIAHEIGHNWFQSMLGSNERNDPWLDEGLNSFYERAYNDSKYNAANFESMVPSFLRAKDQEMTAMEGGVSHLYCCGRLGAIDQCSQDMDAITYVSNSYQRMAWSLQYLQAYLGVDYDIGMKTYFKKWVGKHPQPEDLQASLELQSGKDLSWFFDGLLRENKPFDYKIKEVQAVGEGIDVLLKNRSEFNIPVAIDCYDTEGQLVYTQWVEPEHQLDPISLPANNYERLSINGDLPFLDSDRKDNHYYVGKMFPRKPRLSTSLLARHGDSQYTNISYLPSLTYNNYDGLMLGALLYNDFYPYNKTRWMVQPSYGINSGDLVGRFAVEHDLKKVKEGAHRFTLGLKGQRFSFAELLNSEIIPNYYKLEPSVTMHLNKGMLEAASLSYKVHYINREEIDFLENEVENISKLIHQFNYQSSQPTRLGRADLLIQAEYESYKSFVDAPSENYLKLGIDYKRRFHYKEHSQFFFRIYGGYFPVNSRRESSSFANVFTQGSIALTQEGYTDHTYENYFLGRTEQSGFVSRQLVESEGGFKMPLSSAFSVGMSNDYLVSVNLKIDAPFGHSDFIKVRPYLDAAMTSTKRVSSADLSTTFLYAGGLAFEIGEVAGLYWPLIYSEEFDAPLAGRNLFSKLSFKLNINKLNPWRLVEQPGILIK